MEFKAVDINEYEVLPPNRSAQIKDLLRRFDESRIAIAEVNYGVRYANIDVALQTIRQGVRRYNYSNIGVSKRGEKIYLINHDIFDELKKMEV